jgi:hypothetical protein
MCGARQMFDVQRDDEDISREYLYARVSRWSRKVPGGNVFALDKFVVPTNINNSHWCCTVAHVQERRIEYYDSYGGLGAKFCNGLKRFFADEAKKWAGKVRGGCPRRPRRPADSHVLTALAAHSSPEATSLKPQALRWHLGPPCCLSRLRGTPSPQVDASLLDVASWTVTGTAASTPRQLNGVDCGVFTSYFANFLSAGAPLRFSQADIPLFRRRMTLDILNKQVD